MSDLYLGGKNSENSSKNDLSSATVTLQTQSLTYDGTVKTRNVSSVVLNGQTLIAGTDYVVMGNKAMNAGTYRLFVAGIGDYDGFVSVDWSISKAQGSISVSPTSLSLIGVESTDTAMISKVGDGAAVSAQSSNSSIATVEINGNIVTVTSVSGGSATITFTLATGINYTGGSATITVNVIVPSATLSDNTPALIQMAVQDGTAPTLWSVGDRTAEISIAAFSRISATSACAFILGFDHNSSKEGDGVHFQFGKTTNGTDICFYSLTMQGSRTNSGGWNGSNMRTTHCPAFLAALPSDWQAVIADCDKYSDNTGGGSDTASYVTKTTDKIFLLAEYEVFGARTYANSQEKNYQAQYAYYANGNSKIKYQHTSTGSAGKWWLRSVRASNSAAFCSVYTSGSAGNDSATSSNGFAPGFKVA